MEREEQEGRLGIAGRAGVAQHWQGCGTSACAVASPPVLMSGQSATLSQLPNSFLVQPFWVSHSLQYPDLL